jgi:hypothetical protein
MSAKKARVAPQTDAEAFAQKSERDRVANVERALAALVEATLPLMPLRGFERQADMLAFFRVHVQAKQILRDVPEEAKAEALRIVEALRVREARP